MSKIAYIEKNFRAETLEIVEQANAIIKEYEDQGFDLTLRQLYYQFVARDLIPNTQRDYKRLGSIINDARLAGLIDWESIIDRTRNLQALGHWNSPESIIRSAERGYHIDFWKRQEYRPEVWVEKEALIGVFARVCNELDIPYFACKGYNSQSEMWGASQRFLQYIDNGQVPIVLHFGDHDPSGVDMTRDIEDRLEMFTEQYGVEVNRLALNWDQIEMYNPPPNFAKITDSRAVAYIAEYGEDSWELDAMEPQVLAGLVREAVDGIRDYSTWAEDEEREELEKAQLRMIRQNWSAILDFLGNGKEQPQ
jgi:hypothetical protein